MSLLDFFDVNDKSHLEAVRELAKNGVWPDGFIPNDIEFPPNWQVHLGYMMAKAWIDYKLGSD